MQRMPFCVRIHCVATVTEGRAVDTVTLEETVKMFQPIGFRGEEKLFLFSVIKISRCPLSEPVLPSVTS